LAAEPRLVNIWEDTVDLRQLLFGLVFGGALGFAAYAVAIRAVTARFPNQTPNLLKGYALMAGIAGCVAAAVLIAAVIRPKRLLRETVTGPTNQVELLRGLALNLDDERAALDTASPELIREMQQLHIYDLFRPSSKLDTH